VGVNERLGPSLDAAAMNVIGRDEREADHCRDEGGDESPAARR
jgi:hypothetical protein